MSSEIHVLSPREDSLMIPSCKRPIIEEKKEQIEYNFRITIKWKDSVSFPNENGGEEEYTVTILSILGQDKERDLARQYIEALYQTGPDYKDEMVQLPMEMYGLVSAAPILRHIIRQSGAVVYVTFYGIAQVFGTEIAVAVAVSLFDLLKTEYERGRGAADLAVASPNDYVRQTVASLLTPFVKANQRSLGWTALELTSDLPDNVQRILVDWLVEDLQKMGFSIENPNTVRPLSSASPVSHITTALNDTNILGASGSLFTDSDGESRGSGAAKAATRRANDTITLDEDGEDEDVFMVDPRSTQRRVQIIPRSPANNLPQEYLDCLASENETDSIQHHKENSMKRMNILQQHNAPYPPPHPLLTNSPPPNNMYMEAYTNQGHSPRPPSSKKIKGFSDQKNNSIGNSKKDPVSNNSNNFIENDTIIKSSGQPGISYRKVKLKSTADQENPDDWMKDLTPAQVETIILDVENQENQPIIHPAVKNKRNVRTSSHSPPHSHLPPPPPHRLMRSNSDENTAQPSTSSYDVLQSKPLPFAYKRRIIIDGSNVARHHRENGRFSVRGIWLVVQYFLERGHESIFVIIPQWRQATHVTFNLLDEPELLNNELKDFIKWSPCRNECGRKMNSYDDRFIVDMAARFRGVIVSNDKYRDLIGEDESFKDAILNRLLPYMFAEDLFMPAKDPLGQRGPRLDEFLTIFRDEMEIYPDSRPKDFARDAAIQPAPKNDHNSNHRFNGNRRLNGDVDQAPSGINFLPAPSASSPIPTTATATTTTTTTTSDTAELESPRSITETWEIRQELLKLFSMNIVQIDEILNNFPKERDLNILASHVLSILPVL